MYTSTSVKEKVKRSRRKKMLGKGRKEKREMECIEWACRTQNHFGKRQVSDGEGQKQILNSDLILYTSLVHFPHIRLPHKYSKSQGVHHIHTSLTCLICQRGCWVSAGLLTFLPPHFSGQTGWLWLTLTRIHHFRPAATPYQVTWILFHILASFYYRINWKETSVYYYLLLLLVNVIDSEGIMWDLCNYQQRWQ